METDAERTKERVQASKLLRRKGLELLSLIQRITIRRRVQGCHRNRYRDRGGKKAEVAIYVKEGVPYFAGLQRCASIWNCPACATKIAGVRRAEVERVGKLHVERGGTIGSLTLTTSHDKGMDPRELNDVVAWAWRQVQANETYRAMKGPLDPDDPTQPRMALAGFLRAFEVTHGDHGFHPHVHIAMFFDRAFPDTVTRERWIETGEDGEPEVILGNEIVGENADLTAFTELIFRLWSDAIASRGYPRPSVEHGVKLQLMRPGSQAWGRYLTKIGFEFAAAHHKEGRNGSRSMWQVASDAAYAQMVAQHDGEVTDYVVSESDPTTPVSLAMIEAMGYARLANEATPVYVHPEHFALDSRYWPGRTYRLCSTIPDVQVWRDYEEMIRGRRQLEWSRGMKARYQVDTQTDLEIMDEPVGGDLLVAFPEEVWKQIRAQGTGALADLLEAAMEGPVQVWQTLWSWELDVSNSELRWGDRYRA